VGVVSEPLVPCARGLLEAVERLVKPTDVVRMSRVDEARGLNAVDLLVKIAMEEGILDVQLVHRPRARGGNAEDDPDSGWLDDGTESLIKVDAGLLRESTNNPSCLVASETTIRAKLVFE
jgi:hypothetical protein